MSWPGSALVIPCFSLGLLGAAHCIGMCGGFAVGVSAASGPGALRSLRRQLVFVLGKALTYGVLGLLLATAGQVFVRESAEVFAQPADAIGGLQRALALLAGLFMIVLGLSAWRGAGAVGNPLRWGRVGARLERVLRGVQSSFSAARDLPGDAGALATGLVSGLLPCGLSWAALAMCAGVSDPLAAFAGMLAFGLGTAPALIFIGLGWRGLPRSARRLGARAAGPLLILFGLYTGLRGAGGFELGRRAAPLLPECCAESGAISHPTHP